MNDDFDGSPTAGRFDVPPAEGRPTRIADFKTPIVRDLGNNSARVIVAGAVTALFGAVLVLDVVESKRFWKDLHDVSDTFAPFVTLVAGAVGAAATYFFADHRSDK